MSCKILIVGTLLLSVLTACGDPEPVSTGTKAPGLNRAAVDQNAPLTGDATKGQTALTTSCNICHGTPAAHKLTKADVGSVTLAAGKSYHTTVTKAFEDSGDDIKAYLATQ
jgi:cytochrome c5